MTAPYVRMSRERLEGRRVRPTPPKEEKVPPLLKDTT